jgi:carbohydrate-selective porin OprB
MVANGPDLERISRANGQIIEVDTPPSLTRYGTIMRVFLYRNKANMGRYRVALQRAALTGATPDIAADDAYGRKKWGYGINVEQPLADNGETGLFLRAGWNDGKTETFAFTEIDQTVTVGAQIAGNHWGRELDRVGIALALNGLSRDHRDYLAAGGSGFVLGDGRLNYGWERVVEVYYRIHLAMYQGARVQLSPDIQYIQNPGMNQDRGPVTVYGFRFHAEY